MLFGDAARLRQILLNLLGNSVKFTEKGEIVVSVDKAADKKREIVLHFSIRDTGIGIPKEKQDMIFDAFSQADSSVERRRGGTGLGLTISRSLVDKMGGQIWAESDTETGSTFHFTIKFTKKNVAGQKQVVMQHPRPGSAQLADIRVLLIDDNDTNRIMLGRWLRQWGFQVTEAQDGPTGLAALKESENDLNSYSLVLLDRNMPVNDGFAVAVQIQNSMVIKPIILMMLDACTIGGDLSRCREMKIFNYVVKPIGKRKLYESIMFALGFITNLEKPKYPAETSGDNGAKLKILVAEDNATSQLIARKMLEQKGHTVCIVENGALACDKVAQSDFDLVLMDVEMPALNGLDAARAIRAGEKKSGRRIPIVAMTAYATKEDKEKCLASGMDDYLVKPVKARDLYAMIDKLLTEEKKVAVNKGVEGKPLKGDAVDLKMALESVGGDKELLWEALNLFMEQDYPQQLIQLKEGLDSMDAPKIKAAAHSIKGNARTFGGVILGDIALQIEEKGRQCDLKEVPGLVNRLELEFERFRDFYSLSKI